MIVTIFLLLTMVLVFIYSLKLMFNGDFLGIIISLISIICLILIIYPNLALLLANILGVGKSTDLLLFASFIIGILLVIAIHIKIKRLNIMITKLARRIAIMESIGK